MILVFGGTTEGTKTARLLKENGADFVVSTATEYGMEAGIPSICGRLDSEEMRAFMEKHGVTAVIDATHPYACEVSRNIRCACGNIPYIRIARKSESMLGARRFDSVEEIVAALNETDKTALITTGSNSLEKFAGVYNYEQRLYIRILPIWENIKKAHELGFHINRIIAMHGPFSEEMNAATLKYANAEILVTKESGREGGFSEKLSAAKEAGAEVYVLGRPDDIQGVTPEEGVRQALERRY